jgi:uncharacterized CHY-type Zn-finger protein
MSSSNNFNVGLNQTSLNNAYQFDTHSEFIKQMKMPAFSPNCIFCSCMDTISLNQEGSFRQCRKCNKQFKATFPKVAQNQPMSF